jgi:hypothetical protein
METALPLIAVLGFFAGTLVVPQILRWIALLLAVTGKQGGDFLGPSRRRLLWVAPFVVFFHPTLYMIGALVTCTGFCLFNRGGGELGWFLVGLYVHIIVSGLSVASRYRQIRRRSGRT